MKTLQAKRIEARERLGKVQARLLEGISRLKGQIEAKKKAPKCAAVIARLEDDSLQNLLELTKRHLERNLKEMNHLDDVIANDKKY